MKLMKFSLCEHSNGIDTTMGSLIIYGDPHGNWVPLLKACAAERPDGVVILGDCDLKTPLRQQLKPLLDAGIRLRWIPGNHDVDTHQYHDFLWGDYPQGNLHGTWGQVGGMIVGGLGGVFYEEVWYPRFEEADPHFRSRKHFVRQLPPADRLDPHLRRQDAIFPEDVRGLSGLHVDVLVCHEAPSSHKNGFLGIDAAAALCRAPLIVHGHHHRSTQQKLPGGCVVRGLDRAEVFWLRR
jgi:predicted phosphodiesterase